MPVLDLEVLHRGRNLDTFQCTGDPRDAGWLQERLRDWLTGHKWHKSRWDEFEMVARRAGTWAKLATVRT